MSEDEAGAGAPTFAEKFFVGGRGGNEFALELADSALRVGPQDSQFIFEPLNQGLVGHFSLGQNLRGGRSRLFHRDVSDLEFGHGELLSATTERVGIQE